MAENNSKKGSFAKYSKHVKTPAKGGVPKGYANSSFALRNKWSGAGSIRHAMNQR
jgi:hypothetical protein